MKHLLIITALLILLPSQLRASDVLVFVAASALAPMNQAAEEYRKLSGQRVVVSGAASSTLARQIERGAKADLFLSASVKWMSHLSDKGYIQSQKDYLSNKLVLVTHVKNNFDGANWPTDLPQTTENSRIAMGDPAHVPAGVYAKEALVNLKLWGKLKSKIAPAQTVTKALLFVESGVSIFGIVYASNLNLSKNVTSLYSFPSGSHRAIKYPLGLSKMATASAYQFYEFLLSKKGKAIFKAQGFSTNE